MNAQLSFHRAIRIELGQKRIPRLCFGLIESLTRWVCPAAWVTVGASGAETNWKVAIQINTLAQMAIIISAIFAPHAINVKRVLIAVWIGDWHKVEIEIVEQIL